MGPRRAVSRYQLLDDLPQDMEGGLAVEIRIGKGGVLSHQSELLRSGKMRLMPNLVSNYRLKRSDPRPQTSPRLRPFRCVWLLFGNLC